MRGSARELFQHVDILSHRKFGEWLSLVEHLVRDQGVGGSNPLSPTILSQTYRGLRRVVMTSPPQNKSLPFMSSGTGTSHRNLGFSGVEMLQFRQVLRDLQASRRNRGAIKIQGLQLIQAAECQHGSIRDLGMRKAQHARVFHGSQKGG